MRGQITQVVWRAARSSAIYREEGGCGPGPSVQGRAGVNFFTTVFIEESAREVVHRLVEAIALVFIVVFIFLQS